MNSEADFQRMLDANPEDWQTRLVLADWLQDRGDPRADGYRALGALRRYPERVNTLERGWVWRISPYNRMAVVMDEFRAEHSVPTDWFDHALQHGGDSRRVYSWLQRKGRAALENELAASFALLPEERRSELLAGNWYGGKRRRKHKVRP